MIPRSPDDGEAASRAGDGLVPCAGKGGWAPPRYLRVGDHPATRDRVPDGEDDHGADDGDDDALEVQARDVGDAEHGAREEPADDRADDAEEDRPEDALTTAGDEVGDEPGDGSENDP